ncbi:MAG: 3'-5' exonuclease, partial [Ruminococcus sp.]|nr:3'-5' exonuclease [Ruminococcus sp.]
MLQFILGKSGTGKTTLIYEKIKELAEAGNDKILMLVPDQSSFETEKAFLDILGAKRSKNVKVFGFSRICRYVFEQTSNLPQNVIDNGTRAVIMSIALEQLTEKLKLLKSKNTKSLTEVMLQTLSDCKKNNISTDMLYKASERVADTTLKTKLYETALVLDTFDALVSQSYIDPLDDLTRLFNILSENNIFKDYNIFIDSFSGFTSQQLKVLRFLIPDSNYTCVALTLDPFTDGREEVFATSQATYKNLKNLAKKDFVDIKAPIKLTECMRFTENELSTLESCIFRNDFTPENGNPENIILYSADDTYSECEFVARQIKKLVIEENYLYSDISVICHDTDPYDGILNVVFDKYEIPYFMDTHKDIEVKPVVRFVNSLFRIVLDNFERDDVISLLKTGLTQNTSDEISLFENYLYVWNINNSAFKNEFTQNPKGFAQTFSERDTKTLKIVEKVRKSIVEPVLKFKESTKDITGREITAELYSLFCEMNVQKSLADMYDILESGEEKGLGAEQIRIWNMLMEVLDKTVAVTGDMKLSLKRYYELLSIQMSAIELS